MDMDNIECVSVSDLDEDEIHHHQQQHPHQHHGLHPHPHHHSDFSSSKPRNGNNVNGVNIVGPTAITPATSVHELLECPVCTNSMYPPIHQVSCLLCVLLFLFRNCFGILCGFVYVLCIWVSVLVVGKLFAWICLWDLMGIWGGIE